MGVNAREGDDPTMNHQHTCRNCGEETTDGWYLEDDYALETGYCIALDDPDADFENVNPFVCDMCMEDVGFRGDTYVIARPEYPDVPEEGDVRTIGATVDNGILVSRTARHEPAEPDSDEFRLISAYERNEDLPTEMFEYHYDIEDDAEWEQIGTGWHSSLEHSDLADAINAITNGELGVYGPVLVKFSETNNVCSVGLTVYAPTGLEVWDKDAHDRVPFREYLKPKRSTPGGAFGVN